MKLLKEVIYGYPRDYPADKHPKQLKIDNYWDLESIELARKGKDVFNDFVPDLKQNSHITNYNIL